jgi:3'(2'), 5'-bisphosphate nucleotidase
MLKGELNVVDKGSKSNFDPQTEADRKVQNMIIGSLSNQFKKLKIIGEEGEEDLSKIPKELIIDDYDLTFLEQNKCPDAFKDITEQDLVVWLDPLDGTNEYVHGFVENVTVLIGIAYREASIGGIIHQPFYKCERTNKMGRTIWGLKELGTSGYVKRSPPENKFILTTTRSHSNEMVNATIEAIKADQVLRVGGCGFKVLQLLEGAAHAYIFASVGCKKWDTCACEAILEADGGVLSDINGKHYSYGANVEYPNKYGVLATAKGIDHDGLIEKIPQTTKEAMSKKK